MLNRNGRKERNTALLLVMELKIINIFYRSYIIVIYLYVIHFLHIGTKLSIYFSNIPVKYSNTTKNVFLKESHWNQFKFSMCQRQVKDPRNV